MCIDTIGKCLRKDLSKLDDFQDIAAYIFMCLFKNSYSDKCKMMGNKAKHLSPNASIYRNISVCLFSA